MRLLLNWLGYALFYNSSRSHNFLYTRYMTLPARLGPIG
ncbi:hypothetical protein P186_1651 [Pyrobaculum ferrireducens]|uniref:Uncharacterized protein n=1 Tax=Pyrobaculum ferrireducens TaxID=1104324 RepID=G7VG69_9CREN|nr:hypothetical protein P186_1651 [Pyrobaculum ferrireducens]